jgi:hypothetical protein
MRTPQWIVSALRALQGKKMRKLFHWKRSGVLIPFLWGLGVAMLSIGVSLPSAVSWVFGLAYPFFCFAAFWTLGY